MTKKEETELKKLYKELADIEKEKANIGIKKTKGLSKKQLKAIRDSGLALGCAAVGFVIARMLFECTRELSDTVIEKTR